MWHWFDRHHTQVALVGVFALASVGFLLHRDYGVPWDEPAQRGYAQVVSRYMFNGDARLFTDVNRIYGPAHELLLLAAEKVFAGRDTRDVFAVRHLCNFLVFVFGVVCLYRLGVSGLGSGAAALLVCLALVLSPLIFSAAFYNSKDLPFLSCFIFATYTLLRFIDRPRMVSALGHGFASAWLIAIRVPGVLIPALTIAGAIWCCAGPAADRRKRAARWVLVYLAVTSTLTVACWPTLWRHPIGEFLNALQKMSRYPWPSDVLYRGTFVRATALPWHYAVVWIAITTPPLYLVGLVAGVPAMARRAVSNLRDRTAVYGFFPVLVLAWAFVPLLTVMALHSVLYDGWRHLFFVYPALLLISMQGFLTLARHRRIAAAAAIAVAVEMTDVASFMIRAHPHEHVFFNSFVGGPRGARFRYEMDYWGLSYRRGLETIAASDGDPLITIFAADPSGPPNAGALAYGDRSRLLFVDGPEHAKYFVGTYRLQQREYDYGRSLYQERVGGAPIMAVQTIDPELRLTPETSPAVRAVCAQNEAAVRGLSDAALRVRAQSGVAAWLSRFVRNARTLDVELAAGSEELHQGRFTTVRVLVRGGEIGDFRHRSAGVPLEAGDATLQGAVFDMSQTASAEWRPVYVERVAVSELVLDSAAINRAFHMRRDALKDVSIAFAGGAIHVRRLDSPRVEAALYPRAAPDPWKSNSDNLWLDPGDIRIADWPMPVTRLLRLLLRRISPLVGPDIVWPRLTLGAIDANREELRLGTRVATAGASR